MNHRTKWAVLVLVAFLLSGCATAQPRWADCSKIPELERQIGSALPDGSTREEIEGWLTKQGIEHSFTESSNLADSALTIGQFPPSKKYSGMIEGIVRDANHSLLVSGNFQLIFLLANNGKLCARKVKWIGTGP